MRRNLLRKLFVCKRRLHPLAAGLTAAAAAAFSPILDVNKRSQRSRHFGSAARFSHHLISGLVERIFFLNDNFFVYLSVSSTSEKTVIVKLQKFCCK